MLGGPSAERDVSRRSGKAVAKALRQLGHEVYELDPSPRGWRLPAGSDVVFLALHGSYGEDGGIQKELDKIGVPYTGCGPDASRIAFDKALAKKYFLKAGIPTPRYEVFHSPAPWPEGWKAPIVLKPACQGSSVGLQMVNDPLDWNKALTIVFRQGSPILMEERILGREVTVGILNGRALPVIEIRVKEGIFDYKNKYSAGAAEHVCPADFSPETTAHIQQVALDAFKAIGGRDYARVDVMIGTGNKPFVLEVNTLPGMMELSLLPEAARAAGIDYRELCRRMIDLALERTAEARA